MKDKAMARTYPNRFFESEEMTGDGLSDVYLRRWTLLSTRWFKVYLHHFLTSDWCIDPHDHPKNFLSIGVVGSYTEEVYGEDRHIQSRRKWKAPWIRWFPAEHIHRIELAPGETVWTICAVGKTKRSWGFYPPKTSGRKWVEWVEYIRSGMAKDRLTKDHPDRHLMKS